MGTCCFCAGILAGPGNQPGSGRPAPGRGRDSRSLDHRSRSGRGRVALGELDRLSALSLRADPVPPPAREFLPSPGGLSSELAPHSRGSQDAASDRGICSACFPVVGPSLAVVAPRPLPCGGRNLPRGSWGLGLTVMAGPKIWVDYWSYARVLTLLPLATWLACLHQRKTRLLFPLLLAANISLFPMWNIFVHVIARRS